MQEKLFHSTDKGLSNEDWYYLVKNEETGTEHILHKWSHGGPFDFKSDERTYSMEEFEKEKPNQYKKYVEWINK